MKIIDGDVKKQTDDFNETRNQHQALSKKEGNSFMNKDLSDDIYG